MESLPNPVDKSEKITQKDDVSVEESLAGDVQYIKLIAEELVMNKQSVNIGEVTVRKEIVTEMRTIEVPIQREELVVERHNLDGSPPTESLRILLKEEQVSIDKKLVVIEEVEVSKRKVTEVQRFDVTLKHEELRIETKNDATQPSPPLV